MKIYSEIKLENFTAWSGAEVTKSTTRPWPTPVPFTYLQKYIQTS
jgi:hypothetical protein